MKTTANTFSSTPRTVLMLLSLIAVACTPASRTVTTQEPLRIEFEQGEIAAEFTWRTSRKMAKQVSDASLEMAFDSAPEFHSVLAETTWQVNPVGNTLRPCPDWYADDEAPNVMWEDVIEFTIRSAPVEASLAPEPTESPAEETESKELEETPAQTEPPFLSACVELHEMNCMGGADCEIPVRIERRSADGSYPPVSVEIRATVHSTGDGLLAQGTALALDRKF